MKNSRWQFGLLVLLIVLFCISVKIAIDLPPRHRLNGSVVADQMRGIVAKLSADQWLTVDLVTGKFSVEQDGPVDFWSRDRATGWTVRRFHKDNQSVATWELTTDKKDITGERKANKFEFPFEPIQLDDTTVVGIQDSTLNVVDLNSKETKSLSFSLVQTGKTTPKVAQTQFGIRSYLQIFSIENSNAPTTYWASLFLIGSDDSQPLLLWSKPVISEFAVNVIAGSVYLVCPTKNTIDQFDFASGQLVSSTPMDAAMVARLNATPPAAVLTIQDGPIPILSEHIQLPTRAISRFWTIPELAALPVPEDSTSLYGMDDPNHLIYVRYNQNDLEEIGKFNHVDRKFVWVQKLARNVTAFSRSTENKRWCFAVDSGLEFITLDGQDGKVLSHLTPFRWVKWSLPAVALGLTVCSLLLVNLATSTKQLRWTVFPLSLVYFAPFLLHLWYWGTHDRVVPCHHYLEGFMVAAMIGCAAWIIWGDGRIIKRLVPFFCMLTMLFVLTRWMLSSTWLIKEGVMSTLMAGSIAFPLFFGLRLIGFGKQSSSEQAWRQRAWTLPIRDLFLFSTCIAVLVAVANPLLKKFEIPTGLPPQVESFLIGAAFLYLVVCWLLFCHVRRWVFLPAVTIIILTALTLLAGLYQFSSGNVLLYDINSLQMAIFRVVTSAAITFYFFARMTFEWKGTTPDQVEKPIG